MKITENKLFWSKGHEDTIIPTKRDEDSGYDIYARFDQQYMVIPPHETKLIPTDLYCAMPIGYGLEFKERGSTGSKGIKVSAGEIDSGFRDAMFVAITNINTKPVVIFKDDMYINNLLREVCILYPYEKAICQGVVRKIHDMDEKEITLDELLVIDSERGQGKLGDSGK